MYICDPSVSLLEEEISSSELGHVSADSLR